MSNKIKPVSIAQQLADKIKPSLPDEFTATVCIHVNMMGGSSPEMTVVCLKEGIYRGYKTRGTVDVIREKTRTLFRALSSQGHACAFEGTSIYIKPEVVEVSSQALLDIQALESVQSSARNLQRDLDAKEARWHRLYNRVKNTPEWAEHCRKKGSVTNYTWGDALA